MTNSGSHRAGGAVEEEERRVSLINLCGTYSAYEKHNLGLYVCIGQDSRRLGLLPGEMRLRSLVEQRHRVEIRKRLYPSKEERTQAKLN